MRERYSLHREFWTEPLVWAVGALLVAVEGGFVYWVWRNGAVETSPTFYLFVVAMLGVGVLVAGVLNFFRVPVRRVVAEPADVIAPCDGKVVVIEPVVDRELGPCTQLSIFMSPLDVHVNYSPIAGTVERVDYLPGKYLVAWHPKSSTDNEQTRWRLRTESGIVIGMKQIAGALARRIRWYAEAGQAVTAGAEVGFIKFGSRVDLLLPRTAEITVKLGDRTVGGESRVAVLS